MPFCRKCGRRLVKYSESCPECKTSTTAPLIKIKKARVDDSVATVASKKIAKAIIPAKPIVISVKVIAPNKAVKTIAPEKTVKAIAPARIVAPTKSTIPAKPVTPAIVYPQHEIIKSKVSLEEDIITNPQDYEKQTFGFDLTCPHRHFWPAGRAVIVSKGNGYCPRCGERLRKPRNKKSQKPPRSKLI